MRRKQKGVTLTELLIAVIVVVLLVGYVKNIVKFVGCDFASPYKCEVIHGLGLFPAVGWITGWLDVGK